MVRCGLTKEPGCYCKDGYVRKTYRGECITYDECEANSKMSFKKFRENDLI